MSSPTISLYGFFWGVFIVVVWGSYFCLFFAAKSQVAQAGCITKNELQVLIFSPLPPKDWDDRL